MVYTYLHWNAPAEINCFYSFVICYENLCDCFRRLGFVCGCCRCKRAAGVGMGLVESNSWASGERLEACTTPADSQRQDRAHREVQLSIA